MAVSKRKCKFCKEYNPTEKGVKHPIGWFCCQQHALNFASEQTSKRVKLQIAKAKQVQANKNKAIKSDLREFNRKSLKWQHKQTQIVFNKLRRLQELKWFSDRGLEPVCISCQKPLGNDQWANGHFKTVGSNGRLRYDFSNSFLQHNMQCNMKKSGDIDGYKKGLVVRFGEAKAKEIIDYCEKNNSPIKYTWQEIEALRVEFNKKIKKLNHLSL